MTTQNPTSAATTSEPQNIVVTALYKFTRFDDYEDYREPLRQLIVRSRSTWHTTPRL